MTRIISLRGVLGTDYAVGNQKSGIGINNQQTEINNHKIKKLMGKKEIWKIVIQTLITILTAIGTSLGVVGCM